MTNGQVFNINQPTELEFELYGNQWSDICRYIVNPEDDFGNFCTSILIPDVEAKCRSYIDYDTIDENEIEALEEKELGYIKVYWKNTLLGIYNLL